MSWLDDIFSGIADAFSGGSSSPASDVGSIIDFSNADVLPTVVDNSGDWSGITSAFTGNGSNLASSALDSLNPTMFAFDGLGSGAVTGALNGGLDSTPIDFSSANFMPTQVAQPVPMSGISTGEGNAIQNIGNTGGNAPASALDMSGGKGNSVTLGAGTTGAKVDPNIIASGSLTDKAIKSADDMASGVWNWVKEHKLPTAVGVLMLANMFANRNKGSGSSEPATVAAPSMGNTAPMKFNYSPKYTPLSAGQTARYGLSSNATQAPAQWSNTVPVAAARGGSIPDGGLGGGGRSRYVRGAGTGQSDDIPAKLSDGEYVIDADTVAALGDGSNEAGARRLDEMRKNIRKHKRSAPADKIPPKAKRPEQYIKRA